MLVLTRTINEKIVIGDDVSVTVLGVKGHQVRIGIEAPLEIPVHREEIYQRILKERADGMALPYVPDVFDFKNSLPADS